MSIPDRLWRIARQRAREGFGLDETRKPVNDARRELEEFMQGVQAPRSRDASSQPSSGPAPHPLEQEYRVLGAPVGSDLNTVRSCWRRLVRENHPDRFPGDPEAQSRATERLHAINDSYRRLRDHLGKE